MVICDNSNRRQMELPSNVIFFSIEGMRRESYGSMHLVYQLGRLFFFLLPFFPHHINPDSYILLEYRLGLPLFSSLSPNLSQLSDGPCS